MPKITTVSQYAKKLGLQVGDEITSLGGFPMRDELDYLFYDSAEKVRLDYIRNGEKRTINVKKDEEQPLGLEFDIEMKPFRCKNNCIFCFIDQLPKGMRDTLYVKDDDYRFSFISGSYVTLTNVSDEEIERIIRLKLSPLYVSVHALDDKVRLEMVKNPNTLKLVENMKKLGEAGIKMHTQLVVVPGVNDGKVLEDSIRGLNKMQGVETVAVVPVGLTCHRNKLPNLPQVSAENAKITIEAVEKLHCELNGFCWCADEYYVIAGKAVKDFTYYGAFEQIENGVGLLADFDDNLDYSLSIAKTQKLNKRFAFVTGVAFQPILKRVLPKIESKLDVKCEAYGIVNNFFGSSVTVAGLVTAGDIAAQLAGGHSKTSQNCGVSSQYEAIQNYDGSQNCGVSEQGETSKNCDESQKSGVGCNYDAFVVPDNMLREFTDMFLDGVSLAELEKQLGKPIVVVSHNGADLVDKLIEFAKKSK